MTAADFVLAAASARYRMTGDGTGSNAEHCGVHASLAISTSEACTSPLTRSAIVVSCVATVAAAGSRGRSPEG
jgi:hypothetical protein